MFAHVAFRAFIQLPLAVLRPARHLSSQTELSSLGKLLVANRGEIACRVIKTARLLGVPTVAVYSDADRNALHVRMSDEAVCIGAAPPRDSYLNIDNIIAAARRTGARSVHPGYGFLSENVQFVSRCHKEGITFVGPPASAIHAMGNKSEAKAIMLAANVPVVPGYHGENQDPEFLAGEAERIGFPLLVKAVLGGGGKGMKIARSGAEFQDALGSAKREARAAFNDDVVLLERLIQRPRHVEVQVLADAHGGCVYLFERDCSVQRRHQKVIEEAPAPGLTQVKRREIGEAAVAAARATGYVNAGTVEFIVDTATEEFFFMEMNTRLQVEHPVTELIAGIDLVEYQLRVAAGQRLPIVQQQLKASGHAFEARIYAEKPHHGFLPAIGAVARLRLPANAQAFSLDTAVPRVDCGIQEGDEVGLNYDPLIAKLITWGEDREEALARLQAALPQLQVSGVPTNIEFLSKVASHPAFAACELDTGFIARYEADLLALEPIPSAVLATAMVAKVCAAMRREAEAQQARYRGNGPLQGGPWSTNDAFRLFDVLRQDVRLTVHHGAESTDVTASVTFAGANNYRVRLQAGESGDTGVEHAVTDVQIENDKLLCCVDEMHTHLSLSLYERAERQFMDIWMHGQHHNFSWPLQTWTAFEEKGRTHGQVVSPMTGRVSKVAVKEGQHVKAKDVIVVVEAMKMEHAVLAPSDGVVESIFYEVGQTVQDSAVLATLEMANKDK